MPAELLIFAYVAFVLAVIFLLTIYSVRRRHRFDPGPSKDRIFRCENCAFVYTDDADVDRSRCSQCGTMNDPMAF
jgi:hypothetical protein